MHNILQDLPIKAPVSSVFEAVSTPDGFDQWWTLRSSGTPVAGFEYSLDFGPDYQWAAKVTICDPGNAFELQFTAAAPDWLGTRVSFELEERSGVTLLRFAHRGWQTTDHHFRTSAHCWALYLRILRRFLEAGEIVPYETRLGI